MKILVVIGDCILTNSSANLCHMAYLRGLSELKQEITFLTCDDKDYPVDNRISLPSEINLYTVNAMSIYQRLSINKSSSGSSITVNNAPNTSVKDSNSQSSHSFLTRIKRFVLSKYGVYGITAPFIRKSQKFKSDVLYDYVISVAYPAASHKATYQLLRSKRIKAKHWIQIWEDPWFSDVYGCEENRKVFEEEKYLLSVAQIVYYVSPLTLENAKRQFSDYADKMRWQPLPYYYKENEEFSLTNSTICYGYFGDYVPASRDLKPFYEAAKKCSVKLNICGKPNNLFESTDNICIYPRLPLNELKPLEEKTNVLVFLCNRKGGQIPGKIYQYSATNKIILFILDGTNEEKETLKSFFSQFNRFIFCENTVEDITNAIQRIESSNFGNIINRPLEEFSPKRIVKNILDGKNGF